MLMYIVRFKEYRGVYVVFYKFMVFFVGLLGRGDYRYRFYCLVFFGIGICLDFCLEYLFVFILFVFWSY